MVTIQDLIDYLQQTGETPMTTVDQRLIQRIEAQKLSHQNTMRSVGDQFDQHAEENDFSVSPFPSQTSAPSRMASKVKWKKASKGFNWYKKAQMIDDQGAEQQRYLDIHNQQQAPLPVKMWGQNLNPRGATSPAYDGAIDGIQHPSGWTFTAHDRHLPGDTYEDHFTQFEANHPHHGRVWGDTEGEVKGDTQEGLDHFTAHHPVDRDAYDV